MNDRIPTVVKVSMAPLVIAASLAIAPAPAQAQVGDVNLEASLRCFVEIHLQPDHHAGHPYRCPSRAWQMEAVVQSPDYVGDETVQVAQDLLVDLAHRTTEDKVKRAVCSALVSASHRKDESGGPRIPGVVERLEGLYFSGDPAFRPWCLGVGHSVADRPRMIEFLRRVATEPSDSGHMHNPQLGAINSLTAMGEEGRAAIAELLAAGTISTYSARFQAERVVGRPPGGGGR